MNVVITDNDTALLKSLEIVLSGEGHQVRTFNDPFEACRHLEGGGVLDVLILDYLMPAMTGADLLNRVRAWREVDFTVILISGHTDIIGLDRLEETGVHHFLPKPVDLHQLCRLVAGAGAKADRPGEIESTTWGK
jgi:DNA-binding NtrC family response regulator